MEKGSNRVVFNIGGNKYRVICQYYFGRQKVHLFIKWTEHTLFILSSVLKKNNIL
ncbi:type II toxin-antitoxin system HigB family toxin [Mangrovibacterium lignilyticum]|uniref:type II toxin-antitoxin system HigB family toxin n=1 Tax=Mangrovibacterium lignilyticum TaxID=2668052 RepID=UPI00374333FF